jgi:hypothetical protein
MPAEGPDVLEGITGLDGSDTGNRSQIFRFIIPGDSRRAVDQDINGRRLGEELGYVVVEIKDKEDNSRHNEERGGW